MKKMLIFCVTTLIVSGCFQQLLHKASSPTLSNPTTLSELPKCSVVQNQDIQPSCLEQQGDNPKSPQKALVIGNGNYEYSPLPNPANDAISMTDVLVNMGFYVTQATNLDHQMMSLAIEAFKKRLSPQDVALFYFSGHGAQVMGENYLIPVNNAIIREEEDLPKNAVSAQNVLAMMKNVNKGVNLLILDACRDNPYKGSKRNATRGLARMEAPRGALIAFAAAPGQPALDGKGYNGLYTSHLLDALANAKHKRIEDVFMETQEPVVIESEGKQEPWYQASFRKPFCFGGCSPQ